MAAWWVVDHTIHSLGPRCMHKPRNWTLCLRCFWNYFLICRFFFEPIAAKHSGMSHWTNWVLKWSQRVIQFLKLWKYFILYSKVCSAAFYRLHKSLYGLCNIKCVSLGEALQSAACVPVSQLRGSNMQAAAISRWTHAAGYGLTCVGRNSAPVIWQSEKYPEQTHTTSSLLAKLRCSLYTKS